MSLDNLIECKACGKNLALSLWGKFFGSIEHADIDNGPDFLSVMAPDAAVLKIVICYGCQTMKPSLDYTPEEQAALAKRNEGQIKKVEMGNKFLDLLGGNKAPE